MAALSQTCHKPSLLSLGSQLGHVKVCTGSAGPEPRPASTGNCALESAMGGRSILGQGKVEWRKIGPRKEAGLSVEAHTVLTLLLAGVIADTDPISPHGAG